MDLFLSIAPCADQLTNNIPCTDDISPNFGLSRMMNPKVSLATPQSSHKQSTTPGMDAAIVPLSRTSRRTRRLTIGGAGTFQAKAQCRSKQDQAQTETAPAPSGPNQDSHKETESRQQKPTSSPKCWNSGLHEEIVDGHRDAARDSSTVTSDPSLIVILTEGSNNSPSSKPVYIKPRRLKTTPKAPTPKLPLSGIPNRRASTRRASLPQNGDVDQVTLPEPEVAYSKTFHYTTCPHSSPPCSRPLNVQPTLVAYHETLLAYAPFNLRIHPLNPAPYIYIIEGACGQCDLAARREVELLTLEKYKSKLDSLSAKLHELQGDLDLDSPALPCECYSGIREPTPHPSNPATVEPTIVFTPEVTKQIVALEVDLKSLIKKREREVKFIWRGYTARWGPATLGVYHGRPHPPTRLAQTAATNNAKETHTELAATDEADSVATSTTRRTFEDSDSDATCVASSTTSVTSISSASSSGSTTRTTTKSAISISDTPQARYSDGSHKIAIPPPIDTTKQDGRMQIDWIRRERDQVKAKTKKEQEQEKVSVATRHITWADPLPCRKALQQEEEEASFLLLKPEADT